MFDTNWQTINGPLAAQIEVLNATNQMNVLDGLIQFLLAHKGYDGTGFPPMPDEAALCELHHAATLFLLANPGSYRNDEVCVYGENGVVIHRPPKWQAVPLMMQSFFRELSSIWRSNDTLAVAAYALWRINWIHPFYNGNGRTARAFSYACLCLHMGVILPGTTTVIDQIMARRPDYQAVLKIADDTCAERNRPDLQPMKDFILDLLNVQIRSADVIS